MKKKYRLDIRFSDEPFPSSASPQPSENGSHVCVNVCDLSHCEQSRRSSLVLSEAITAAIDKFSAGYQVCISIKTFGSATGANSRNSLRATQVLKLSTIASQLSRSGLKGIDCKHAIEFHLGGCMNRDSIRKLHSELERQGLTRFEVFGTHH